ncbi:uncharacterized protein C18orf19 homolog A isoform X2 [Prorops nasuta]|uniref:uncharacterized protein C18orf19 homolog A isoform X2 n=1 Tax=Prorops nasuta TaxID=863751 RepID=UPI0034CE8395
MELFLNRSLKLTTISLANKTLLSINASLPACCTCYINKSYLKNKITGKHFFYREIASNYHTLPNIISFYEKPLKNNFNHFVKSLERSYATDPFKDEKSQENKQKLVEKDQITTDKKVSVFQKMKQMTKDYWYILIPVHLATSAGWVAIFYAAAKNGVDIASLMKHLPFGENYIEVIQKSSAGYWALTYALYKIFTPLRYTVTIGGTTLGIRYLNQIGYSKTAPSIFKNKSLKPAPKILNPVPVYNLEERKKLK